MGVVKTASKKKRIEFIVELLSQGLERKAILQKFSKTFKGSARTIDGDIQKAKVILDERNKKKEEIRQQQMEAELKESIQAGLKSDLELEMILCKIAGAEVKVEDWVKGEVVMRGVTPFEVIAAIDKLYKKRGSYPEISLKLKGDKENPVMQPFSDSQVDKLISSLRENKAS